MSRYEKIKNRYYEMEHSFTNKQQIFAREIGTFVIHYFPKVFVYDINRKALKCNYLLRSLRDCGMSWKLEEGRVPKTNERGYWYTL